ncbi:MAG: hypothetical protein H0V71_10900 [Chloroflexi bacterium]|nr:hypothetical protein [Chloroflexota bacterium]
MSDEKIRENRLRRMADRQGLALKKSRRRDQHALDYGMFALVDASTNVIVAGAASGRFDFTLDDVEKYLTQPVPPMLGHAGTTREASQLRQVVQASARHKRDARA